ncbi:hypothetical protein DV738_g2711, partial [Chaetothyriales sp. CBS 135597]
MSDDSPQDAEASSSTGAPALTRRDIEVLIAGFRSFKSAPEVDHAQLTTTLGLSNPRSSTNAWRNLTKKIMGDQLPALPSLSKDGSPKARASATPRATKASKNATAAAAKSNTPDAPSSDPALPATPTNVGNSSFQSKCKETSSSALTPVTPVVTDENGSAVDGPAISEPTTPTPAPSKKARKTPSIAATKQAKGKQANSETAGPGPDAADARKEQIDKAVEEANAVLMGEAPPTTAPLPPQHMAGITATTTDKDTKPTGAATAGAATAAFDNAVEALLDLNTIATPAADVTV